MQVGVVVLPEDRWCVAEDKWRMVEALGFDSAWTYDHLAWRALAQKPWFATFSVLAAAATATQRIRIGTMVTTPNFRHPLLAAKEAMTLDDISGGRLTLGIGSGSYDSGDLSILADHSMTQRERSNRFAEFVELVDHLLREGVTTFDGTFYRVVNAPMIPGCIQQPRVPFVIAAAGPNAMHIAARYGAGWSTVGSADWSGTQSIEDCANLLRKQVDQLRRACDAIGRDVADIERIFMPSPVSCVNPLTSIDIFMRTAEAVSQVGISQLVVHWPRKNAPYASDPAVIEDVATEAFPIVAEM